jgi:hypothetical protein
LKKPQFNGAISNLTQIEAETKALQVNANQSSYSSNQLADLGIEKLPDGRTKVGGMISGQPSVVIDAFTGGVQCYTNHDFKNALGFFQKAIYALESTRFSGVVIGAPADLTPEGRGALYGMSAECALQIQSNSLASEYAQKSVNAAPSAENKILLTYTIANLAIQKAQSNDIAGSFEFFQKAITNYESIGNFDLTTNRDLKSDILRLYEQGISVAAMAGKTNQVSDWRKKYVAILRK